MAEHIELGEAGEALARQFLVDAGYKILETNWRFGKDEIDIIARQPETLVIVEVKTRKTAYYGEPYTAVTRNKQRFLIRAAGAYIERYNLDVETRFDIISIVLNQKTKEIKHIPDAFYPTL